MARRSIRLGVSTRTLATVLARKKKCRAHGVVDCTNLACKPRGKKKGQP